jgi:hypothetical protein
MPPRRQHWRWGPLRFAASAAHDQHSRTTRPETMHPPHRPRLRKIGRFIHRWCWDTTRSSAGAVTGSGATGATSECRSFKETGCYAQTPGRVGKNLGTTERNGQINVSIHVHASWLSRFRCLVLKEHYRWTLLRVPVTNALDG